MRINPRVSNAKHLVTHILNPLNKNPTWKVSWNTLSKLKLRLIKPLASHSVIWVLNLRPWPLVRRWWESRLPRLSSKWAIYLDPMHTYHINVRLTLRVRWMLLFCIVKRSWRVLEFPWGKRRKIKEEGGAKKEVSVEPPSKSVDIEKTQEVRAKSNITLIKPCKPLVPYF